MVNKQPMSGKQHQTNLRGLECNKTTTLYNNYYYELEEITMVDWPILSLSPIGEKVTYNFGILALVCTSTGSYICMMMN